jgi:ubiquinone/menaquinone biosynthesis C-methylase UbiE
MVVTKRVAALAKLAALMMRAAVIMLAGFLLYLVLRLLGRVPGQTKRAANGAYQSEQSQRGEVVYRQRAAFGQPEAVFDLARTRMERRTVFHSLRRRGVTLSPFAELGAERGQTSLLLMSEFGALGAATDLSLQSLQVIPHLRAHFAYADEPLAVCCDILHLPLRDGALPFAFCFATLHHFDDMRPVLAEVRRVVGKGGHFYFGEEPLRRALCLNLYRCPRADRMDRLHRWLARHEWLQYIAEAFVGSREETEYGIVENQSISLRQWQEAMSIFDRCELTCDPLATHDGDACRLALTDLGLSAEAARRRAADLFGSVVSGLCGVEDGPAPATPEEFLAAFICPNCGRPLDFAEVFVCAQCGPFGRQGNVHMLLPRAMNDRLYPQETMASQAGM